MILIKTKAKKNPEASSSFDAIERTLRVKCAGSYIVVNTQGEILFGDKSDINEKSPVVIVEGIGGKDNLVRVHSLKNDIKFSSRVNNEMVLEHTEEGCTITTKDDASDQYLHLFVTIRIEGLFVEILA